MSLTNTNDMVMPVAPMYGGGGNGNGFGFGNDGGAFWLLVLFLFAFNGGWGNGFGGGGGAMPYVVNNDVQRGFDQSAIMNGITGISNAVSSGFANAEISRANANTNLLQSLWNMQMAQQECCCNTRAEIADLKYTVATEACADRQTVSDGVRDIIASNTASTQAVLDKLCQLELDGYKREADNLRSQLSEAKLQASQTAQTATLQRGQIDEIDALYNRLKNCPVPSMPVYGMTPIFTCPNNNSVGCGCGTAF